MRPISGIDPNHGALMITDQCHPHEEVAFFIQDTEAAQANMQDSHVDNLKMSLAHQTPRALVLFNCTSRDEKMMGALFLTSEPSRKPSRPITSRGYCGWW